MTNTQRIGMPLLSAGQAQKEVTHNEALLLLDSLVHGCCSGFPANTPPPLPEAGLSYICGASPIGEWAGRPGCVAICSESGWTFVKPFDGIQLVERSSGRTWRFMAGQWSVGIVNANELRVNGAKVVGLQQPAIPNPTGGNVVDGEARSTLAQVLTALRNHGLIATTG